MDELINNYDLFIFDLDDTIVKTEKYHYEAWLLTLKHFLNDNSFNFSFNFYCSKFHSFECDSIQKYLINELKIKNYDESIKFKNDMYLKIINKNRSNICLVDGFEFFLNKILENNKQFVIVSNSPKIHIELFSDFFPLLKKSSKNYYREILNNKKPNPECYQIVVKEFPNKRMVGFEDSITGIHSITQVDDISLVYFINTQDYNYYKYIINNYHVKQINNYLEI
jgi:beta-phosphoglucomutase-like phosphatase (HAD superfamily)